MFLRIIFFISCFLFFVSSVKAADTDIVINEVMANAPTPETDLEWVELHNKGENPVNLNNWVFEGKTISDPEAEIAAKNYLIMARNKTAFLAKWPTVKSPVIQTGMVLANSGDSVTLVNQTGDYTQTFTWTGDAGDNISWEKVDPETAEIKVSLVGGGTPGQENSVSKKIPMPLACALVLPIDKKVLNFQNINFSWENSDAQPLTFEFILSSHADLSDPIVDEPKISEKSFLVEDLNWGEYFWQVIASNGVSETKSIINNFTLQEPVYSEAIEINELVADPAGDEVQNEWIELYNSSDFDVDLTGWFLEDIKGSLHRYKIESGVIDSHNYLKFARAKTGITLNNDQDGARLYQPNGKLIFETSVFSDGKEGWSWAKNSSGQWEWTTSLTPLEKNVIAIPPTEKDDEEEKPVINKTPIVVKTGKFNNYAEKLIKIEGQVVETNGPTFYINDGSGKAKVYIQAQTEIKKPSMHRGDFFGVIGVVNLYRSVWRILPRVQDDIYLIKLSNSESTPVSVKTTSVKTKTSASKSASTSSSNQARVPVENPFVIKQVKAAQSIIDDGAQVLPPFWVQLVKAITGLALVFVVILVIKVNSLPKIKTIGGHFGRDDT